MRPIHLWRSRTPDGVRCAHFPSVITSTTIMDYKVQLINPLNLGELYMRRSRTVFYLLFNIELYICAFVELL
jgi:hypothetical protein